MLSLARTLLLKQHVEKITASTYYCLRLGKCFHQKQKKGSADLHENPQLYSSLSPTSAFCCCKVTDIPTDPLHTHDEGDAGLLQLSLERWTGLYHYVSCT